MVGQWKLLDLEIQDAVSQATERKQLKTGSLCERQWRY